MHSINLEHYDSADLRQDEGLVKSTGSNPSPIDSLIGDGDEPEDDVEGVDVLVTIAGHKGVDTDENDNSSSTAAKPVQMKPTAFERLFHNGSGSTGEGMRIHTLPYMNHLISTTPDRRPMAASMKQHELQLEKQQQLQQQQHQQQLSPSSGIIFHRTYNKKPSHSVSSGTIEDRLRCDSPNLNPVIRLEDIRWRISRSNRHGNEPPRTPASTIGRSNATRSCIIRRTFHKDSPVASNIAKIVQGQESINSDCTNESAALHRRRISYGGNVKEDRESLVVAEGMDVHEDAVETPDGDDEEAVEASSMANSYGDDGSSCWSKRFSTQPTSTRRRTMPAGRPEPMSEFDLMLQKINQSIPPMSHQDRIDQWRVTADDLLHSIPTKAQIETTSSTCAKRPHYDDAPHLSSDDDSDTTLDDDARAACGHKKRRTSGDRPLPVEHSDTANSAIVPTATLMLDNEHEGLDFRARQVNPEIDKSSSCHHTPGPAIQILERRNYHKLPTRYRSGSGHESASGTDDGQPDVAGTSGTRSPSNSSKPYAFLLSRDEEEREKFLQYLRISPVFRTAEPRPRTHDEKRDDCAVKHEEKNSPTVPLVDRSKASKTRIKPKANKRKPKPVKPRGHPSIIASSGLRGVRRLVLSSSLRSGKVIRYRNNFVNVRTLAKPKAKKVVEQTATMTEVPKSPQLNEGTEPPSTESEKPTAVDEPQQLGSPVPSGKSSTSKKATRSTQAHIRCSVDSAVSSSTSAEMLEQQQMGKRSKECQTLETFPPESLAPSNGCTTVNEGKRLRNPLNRADGEVLHLFLLGEQLVVVQKELVSFWRYSRLCVLLGVKQEWQRVGQIRRWNRDTELDTQNANRIVFNQYDPIYLEPRGRNLGDDKSRTCPLASLYLNAYFAAPADEKNADGDEEDGANDEEQLRLKSFQLDTVKSALEDIRFVPLPNTRDFLVCWYEHVSELESRTGLCKYSLTPDLQTLACIREFAAIKQRLTTLKCINDKKLLGLGSTTVHIWCYESGFLLRTVDLKIELGLIVANFLHIEAHESTLLMLQMQQPDDDTLNCINRKLMKVIAINLTKPTWYIAHNYEIALASMSITSESQQWAMDVSETCHRHCLTFASGEALLLSLNDPTICWTNHQRLQKDLLRAESGSTHICNRLRSNDGGTDLYRPRERILNASHWNGGRDLVFLSDQFLAVRSIDEYMLEEAKR